MLTLIVPGLSWKRQALADLAHDLPLPAFTALLGRGLLYRRPPRDTAAILVDIFGLSSPLPAAGLRALALRQAPAAGDWLCLDPVRLRFENRALVVDGPAQLALDEDESTALAVSLAPTFSALGELDVLAAGAWNLRLYAPAPAFDDLPAAIGRAAAPLPATAIHAPWRRALNEAQMVLHEHPVNRAREAAGRPRVNSVWPWGGGRLPTAAAGATTHDALWGGDPVARGVARLLHIDAAALPVGYAGATGRAPLAIIDALELPARCGDALAWREQLLWLETAWLAPARQALRSGRLDALRLMAPGDAGSAELRVNRRDLWKFWRKPAAVTELGLA
jgi:hypothetical protein